jgi:hypothetical protein
VDGIAGGSNTVGTIASTGLYTAPVSTGTHTIKAVNVNDSTKSATATISVISAVKVTLNTLTAAVLAGNRQQFSATVCGSSNQVLNWSSSGGTVTSTGLFTAPSVEGTYTVTATSAADSSKSASAAVSVFSNVSADFGGRAGGVVIPANLFSAQYVERLPLTVQEMFENAGFSGGRTYAKVQNVYATATPDWTKIDGIISKYQTVGISPIIEMAYAPSWLLPSNPCSVNTAPTDVNQWAQLAASYVAHFDQKFPGLITEYEIWNEPSHNFCNLANKLNTYLSLYAAAGAAMRAQANADGTTIHIGGPVSFGESAWISALLTNSSTAPYVDFISYHQYSFSPADINAGLNWDSSTDTAPLYARTQDPSTGYAALFKSVVAAEGNAKLPVYITEYNDSASFGATCCRNSATFAPVWNALVVADLLNIAYSGTQQLPSRLSYYAAAGGTSTIGYFCLYGTYDSTMDCSVTSGYSAYPQTYAYILLSSSAYLGLSSGGHMALSVAPATTQIGPVATAFYNNTQNAIVIVNPTATNYPSLNVVFKNPGTTASSGTYYLLNSSNSQITSQQISLSPVASGYSTTIVLPRYSVVAVSIGAP